MTLAPIIFFVFNRPEHAKNTIESLKANKLSSESDLFIYSDGPRNEDDEQAIARVRSLIHSISGFKNIHIKESVVNKGLAKSVIAGVSEVIAKYKKVIVVEDDLYFSPFFLNYMNEALRLYKGDPRIFSIGGYTPNMNQDCSGQGESFLSFRCCTWGWATWESRWNSVDWDVKDYEKFINSENEIRLFNRGGIDMSQILELQMKGLVNSWGIRWDYAHYKNQAFCFRPKFSIVGNSGHDGSGIHCKPTKKFDVKIYKESKFHFPKSKDLELNGHLLAEFANAYDDMRRSNDFYPEKLRPINLLEKFKLKFNRY